MKIKTVQILWHNKEAIFSADFEPSGNRLATGGADQTVRVRGFTKRFKGTDRKLKCTL